MRSDAAKRILFKAKYAVSRRQAFPFYRELMHNQRLPPDLLARVNWEKRKRLLEHAISRSPFYREKFRRAGLCPDDFRDPSVFSKIPCLTRDELRQERDRIFTVHLGPRYLVRTSTGGSTGVPVTIFSDRRVPVETVMWRMMSWWGIAPHMDGAYVWRMRRTSRLSRALNALAWWPTTKLRLDASSMDERAILHFFSAFNRLCPPLLQGYTGAISHLAEEVTARGLSVHAPRAVWVTSSPVKAADRERIVRAFRAPVYDQYGCCEVPAIAAECAQQDGLHIHSDTVHVEYVDSDDRPVPEGSPGDIVVTDLTNMVFPLIRYRNGDRGQAMLGRCPCGVTLPRMMPVRGRISDCIRLPSGRTISGEFLTTVFDAFPDAVQQFQVRYKPDGPLMILYVPHPACRSLNEILQKVAASLECVVCGEATIRFQQVNVIPHDRGKHHLVVNEVHSMNSDRESVPFSRNAGGSEPA